MLAEVSMAVHAVNQEERVSAPRERRASRSRRRSSGRVSIASLPGHGMTSHSGLSGTGLPDRPSQRRSMLYDIDDTAALHAIQQKPLNPQSVYEVSVIARDKPAYVPAGGRSKERVVQELERKARRLNMQAMVVGLFGMALGIAGAETLYLNQDSPTLAVDIIKAVNSLCTVILVALVTMRGLNLLSLYKTRGSIDKDETMKTSGMLTPLLFEVLVCLIHAPPGVHFEITVPNTSFDITYTFDALCAFWQLTRLYLCVGVLNDKVGFRTAQARVIAKWNNVSFNAAFTFKALMERFPLQLLGGLMIIAILVLGYGVRVFERPVCSEWRPAPDEVCSIIVGRNDWENLSNSLWFVIITMTTVGYGDTFPVTHAGRVIAIITCFVGVAVVALLVAVITAMSTFRPDEMRAFNALYRNTGRKAFQTAAARMMQACWIYHKGETYAKTLASGASSHQAAKALQAEADSAAMKAKLAASGSTSQNSAGGGRPRRMSLITKFSLANGNLHMRHKSKFGKAHLLHALREWKKRKQDFLTLTREKSEVAMVQKEVLDMRGRMNELMEITLENHEADDEADARLERVELMIEKLCARLGVEEVPMPALLASKRRMLAAAQAEEAAAATGDTGGGGAGAGAGAGSGVTRSASGRQLIIGGGIAGERGAGADNATGAAKVAAAAAARAAALEAEDAEEEVLVSGRGRGRGSNVTRIVPIGGSNQGAGGSSHGAFISGSGRTFTLDPPSSNNGGSGSSMAAAAAGAGSGSGSGSGSAPSSKGLQWQWQGTSDGDGVGRGAGGAGGDAKLTPLNDLTELHDDMAAGAAEDALIAPHASLPGLAKPANGIMGGGSSISNVDRL